MIAVIDYGVGNLFSLCRSLEAVGQTPVVTGDPAVLRRADKLFLPGVEEGDCVYFVHSFYAAECDDVVIATAEYGAQLTAAVARGNVMGCQFHPEKSGTVGLTILKTFCEGEW